MSSAAPKNAAWRRRVYGANSEDLGGRQRKRMLKYYRVAYGRGATEILIPGSTGKDRATPRRR